jgi:hypothetical protein
MEKRTVNEKGFKNKTMILNHTKSSVPANMHHKSQAPHDDWITIFLQVDQQFRPLEITRRHSDIVLATCWKRRQMSEMQHGDCTISQPFLWHTWMIEFCKDPNQWDATGVYHDQSWLTFCGLTSRCMTPLERQKSSATHTDKTVVMGKLQSQIWRTTIKNIIILHVS